MSLLCQLADEAELAEGMPEAARWLSESEQARLLTLGSAARRRSFLAGRWLARETVRRWCGAVEMPVLAVASSGACRVESRPGVFVSISHSAGHVACAVADVPVGVDVEGLSRPRDIDGLAGAVLAPARRRALLALAPRDKALAFMRHWTLAEAWLKARERGLDLERMRTLRYVEDAAGDLAVAEGDGLVMALAANPALPARIDGPPGMQWLRLRSRVQPSRLAEGQSTPKS